MYPPKAIKIIRFSITTTICLIIDRQSPICYHRWPRLCLVIIRIISISSAVCVITTTCVVSAISGVIRNTIIAWNFYFVKAKLSWSIATIEYKNVATIEDWSIVVKFCELEVVSTVEVHCSSSKIKGEIGISKVKSCRKLSTSCEYSS